MTRYIFVSPHYDDAILSCGGTIAGLCEQGAMCSVVTAFGGGPDLQYRLSAVAREYLAEDLGQNVEDITFSSCGDLLRIREEEDKRACVQVGNVVRQVLTFPDAIYRGTQAGAYYATESDLFGKIDEQDRIELEHMLFDVFINMHKEGDYWFFPALSQHIDHRIIHRVGWQMFKQGMEISFFEEFPYRLAMETFFLPSLVPCCISVLNQMQKKRNAVLKYNSQLSSLFGVSGIEQVKTGNLLPDLEYYWVQDPKVFRSLEGDKRH